MNAFLLISALVGATLIVVRGTIFRRIRLLYPPLFRCSQCMGVWVGGAAGAAGIVTTGHSRILDAVIVGAATSFLSLLADAAFINLLGEPLDDDAPKVESKIESKE